jgi:hypothetical protein
MLSGIIFLKVSILLTNILCVTIKKHTACTFWEGAVEIYRSSPIQGEFYAFASHVYRGFYLKLKYQNSRDNEVNFEGNIRCQCGRDHLKVL